MYDSLAVSDLDGQIYHARYCTDELIQRSLALHALGTPVAQEHVASPGGSGCWLGALLTKHLPSILVAAEEKLF